MKSPILRPSIAVAIAYLALIVTMSLANKGFGAIDYVHLGTIWAEHNLNGTWGYDGQFYYQIARDPVGARQFMDNAPYRYLHILYPLVVAALSLGQAGAVPYVLLLVNGLSIVFGVEIFSRLLIKHQLSPWYSLGLGLYFGQATAFAFDTAEPFAYFLVCIALWLLETRKNGVLWAALFMGLAGLSREIAILFPLAYFVYFVVRREWKPAIQFIVLGLVPFFAWVCVVFLTFGDTGLGFTPPFEHLPFAGIFAFAQAPGKFGLLLLLMLLPTVIVWWVALRAIRRREGTPIIICMTANLLLVTFMSRASYTTLIGCGRVSIGLALAGILYGVQKEDRLVLRLVQFYAITFVIYLGGIIFHIPSFIS